MAIHVGEQKGLDHTIGLGHRRAEATTAPGAWRMSSAERGSSRCKARGSPPPHRGSAGPARAGSSHAAAGRGQDRPQTARLGQAVTDHRQRLDIRNSEQMRAQPVIEVVAVIGDIVGQRRDLRLGRGIGAELERMLCIIFGDIAVAAPRSGRYA